MYSITINAQNPDDLRKQVAVLHDSFHGAIAHQMTFDPVPMVIPPTVKYNDIPQTIAPDAPSETTRTATETSSLTGPGQVDSRGVPWSGEVHSTPASTKKDGSWRVRR